MQKQKINLLLRFLVMIICLVAIVSLGIYAMVYGPKQEVTSWQAVSRAEEFEGLIIESGYNRVVGIVDHDVIVAPFGHQINLHFEENVDIRPLDFISYRGQVNAAGYIEILDFHIHRGRSLKYFLSVIPAIIIFIWFWRRYTFNWQQFYFKQRK